MRGFGQRDVEVNAFGLSIITAGEFILLVGQKKQLQDVAFRLLDSKINADMFVYRLNKTNLYLLDYSPFLISICHISINISNENVISFSSFEVKLLL